MFTKFTAKQMVLIKYLKFTVGKATKPKVKYKDGLTKIQLSKSHTK